MWSKPMSAVFFSKAVNLHTMAQEPDEKHKQGFMTFTSVITEVVLFSPEMY